MGILSAKDRQTGFIHALTHGLYYLIFNINYSINLVT